MLVARMPEKASYLQFGEFRIYPSEQRLFRGAHQIVALSPKVFDLLVFLVRNSGRLLTRDDLVQAIWPDTVVEESNLTVNISLLRKILGDAPEGRPFIETIPKKGYRFLAGVTQGQEEVTERTPEPVGKVAAATVIAPRALAMREVRATLWVPFIVALLVLSAVAVLLVIRNTRPSPPSSSGVNLLGPRSLAVLPFQNLKRDPATDFLGFALADSIIDKLGYVSELSVRPSYSIARYAGQPAEPRSIAQDLGVNTLLTGTYVKDGTDMRINVQLVEIATQRIIWRDSMDLKYDHLLNVQDTVTQQIVSGLSLQLSPQEAEHLGADKPRNSRAYEYYLRGVDLYSSSNFQDAILMLQDSARLDPRSARTWAMLGRAETTNASLHFGGSAGYAKALEAYEKALALDPTQLAARVYMANLFTDTGHAERAVPLLKAALMMNPNFAEANWELSYAYRFAGLLNESVALAQRARSFDPSVKRGSSAINGYLYLGQYEKFLASLPPGDSNAYVLFYRGFAEFHLNRKTEAQSDFDRAYALDPSLLPTQVGKALSDFSKNQARRGLELLRATEVQIVKYGVSDAEAIYKVAEAYSVLGDKASALRLLRISIDSGFFCYPYFVRDPLLDPIRPQPEFAQLLRHARHRYEEFQRQVAR